jgi:hypothetical protein
LLDVGLALCLIALISGGVNVWIVAWLRLGFRHYCLGPILVLWATALDGEGRDQT